LCYPKIENFVKTKIECATGFRVWTATATANILLSNFSGIVDKQTKGLDNSFDVIFVVDVVFEIDDDDDHDDDDGFLK